MVFNKGAPLGGKGILEFRFKVELLCMVEDPHVSLTT